MNFLCATEKQATACGKVILVGEHAVVYGSQAVAMALQNITLQITMSPKSSPSWEDVWFIKDMSSQKNPSAGAITPAPREMQIQLTRALEKALSLCGDTRPLSAFSPQEILMESHIPLGGGLGGSAAISVSLIRLLRDIRGQAPLNFNEEAALANEIDHLFHSQRASGLDVSAIASRGMIAFSRTQGVRRVHNRCSFWLALVDSGERTSTGLMVQKVSERLKQEPQKTQSHLEKMGVLAQEALHGLETGHLEIFVQALNSAQHHLVSIGVSTPKIDGIVAKLREQGALAAKVTGAGGGGLVMGVFDRDPQFIYNTFSEHPQFIIPV